MGDDKPTENPLIPPMTINVPQPAEPPPCLISDAMLLGVYNEVMDTIRQDRVEVSDLLNNFVNLVMNEGDSTTSSKEALVQLMKMKTELPDKMGRVADLMTRLKLKDNNTWKPYLNAKQENTINVVDKTSQKDLLKMIDEAQKRRESQKRRDES